MARNPKLVFGRITGWGQTGPLAMTAGHDINYIALTGALHVDRDVADADPAPQHDRRFRRRRDAARLRPDVRALGGCALGPGQVVDAAMTDGASLLMAMIYGFKAGGRWRDVRASNLLDGGAPFYGAYRCADGKFVAVGSLEPQFFDALLAGLAIDPASLPDRWNPRNWPQWHARLQAAFAARPRDEWAQIFAPTDGCVTPILSLEEAPQHPHNIARGTFEPGQGGPQPAPAPRFSRTPGAIAGPPATAGAQSEEILRERGFSHERIAMMRSAGAL